eukprot:3381277-Prymnesium_polylepis.1
MRRRGRCRGGRCRALHSRLPRGDPAMSGGRGCTDAVTDAGRGSGSERVSSAGARLKNLHTTDLLESADSLEDHGLHHRHHPRRTVGCGLSEEVGGAADSSDDEDEGGLAD